MADTDASGQAAPTDAATDAPPDAPPRASAQAAEARVLAVDLPAGQIEALLPQPAPAVVHTRFARLSAEVMARVMPDTVVAPLFGPDFDVLDLLDRLAAFGFAGHLVAVSTPLPNPDAVRAEVRGHAGDIAFDLVILGE